MFLRAICIGIKNWRRHKTPQVILVFFCVEQWSLAALFWLPKTSVPCNLVLSHLLSAPHPLISRRRMPCNAPNGGGKWMFFLSFCGATGSCTLGSTDECGHGICVPEAAFDDPFFNRCECDYCWSELDCSTNTCVFWMIPAIVIASICCCLASIVLCCCCIGTYQQKSTANSLELQTGIGRPSTEMPSIPVVEATVVEGKANYA
ncbi:unnamed protein product [Durusdinium trenchii]|uniref:Uncharacterized protein n=1 Tax=Durusdinium trenchii TaxID=1381693 RepID=A0ABP0J6W0_9DINO